MHLRNFFLFSSFLALLSCLSLLQPRIVRAQVCSDFQVEGNILPRGGDTWAKSITIRFTITNVNPNHTFLVCTDDCREWASSDYVERGITASEISQGVITYSGKAHTLGDHTFNIRNESIAPGVNIPTCSYTYTVSYATIDYSACVLTITSDTYNEKRFTPDTAIHVKGSNIPFEPNKRYSLSIEGPMKRSFNINPSLAEKSFPTITLEEFLAGNYTIKLMAYDSSTGNTLPTGCQGTFAISYEGGKPGETHPVGGEIKEICVGVPEGKSKVACEKCFIGDKDNPPGTWTALGCIPTSDLNGFVAWLLTRVLFIATGIAFLLMVAGAVQILTSAGNPDKVKAGGELITSAVSGLLLIILSAFLLKLIGVDILQIPGFSQ